MPKFYASVPGTPPPTLIIEATAAFDARAIAVRELGEKQLAFQLTGDDAVPDIELKWVGTDAGAHGGSPSDRHLEMRRRTEKVWSKWQRT